jgi:hypothetical protein
MWFDLIPGEIYLLGPNSETNEEIQFFSSYMKIKVIEKTPTTILVEELDSSNLGTSNRYSKDSFVQDWRILKKISSDL